MLIADSSCIVSRDSARSFLAEPNEFLEQCRDSVSTISRETKIGKYLATSGVILVLLAVIGLGSR